MKALAQYYVQTRRYALASVLIFLMTFSACSQNQDEVPRMTVFAASSLTIAFEIIEERFEERNEVDVVLNFGGSSSLALQIIEGADAQIFASANSQQMERVLQSDTEISQVQIFASNKLAIVVPANNPANVETINDLTTAGVKLITAAPGVPIREYTDSMLNALSTDPVYGPGFAQRVLANLVSEEDNVRQVIAKIVLGEADAAIVYRSDITAEISDSVTIIPIPEGYDQTIAYPIAIIGADRRTSQEAGAFIRFLLSEEGQRIMANAGFIPVCTTDCQD